MIEKGNNYIRNYESRMAELQQNEEVDQASIDFLQQNIINQNNCVQKCQEELERVRQFANPIMTDEKKAMVADILTSLTDQEKETFRQVLSVRYQHTQNLLIALILYEYFDDAVSLKKYLKERAPIATRLSNKIPAAMYTHVMSFLRSNSDDIEQRLTAALRKAITQKDEELSGLLVQNGAELDINEKIEAQFN
jgi:hypothetical protein